jgi:Holliday junction resolvasome RuvABC endonuclease subunit
MIKSLKKLERNLGFKLRNNTFCLAVDTATKSGIAMIDINKGKLQIRTYLLTLPKLSKDSESKAEKYQEHLAEFVKLIDNTLIPSLPKFNKEHSLMILENSFLKMNVVTFGFLRALQGIIYAKLCDKFGEIKIIFPITARNLVGFQTKLPRGTKGKDKKREIMTWISNVVEEEIQDDNVADALLLCFAGLKL